MTRKYLHQQIQISKITEINIADDHPLLTELRPKVVPTVLVIDDQSRVIFLHEGQLGPERIESIARLL